MATSLYVLGRVLLLAVMRMTIATPVCTDGEGHNTLCDQLEQAYQRTGCCVHKARSEALHDELAIDPVRQHWLGSDLSYNGYDS